MSNICPMQSVIYYFCCLIRTAHENHSSIMIYFVLPLCMTTHSSLGTFFTAYQKYTNVETALHFPLSKNNLQLINTGMNTLI